MKNMFLHQNVIKNVTLCFSATYFNVFKATLTSS